MASIREIAKRAGVSVTTVSKALNNYSDVSPITKKRILSICKELDYTPNPVARNLAAKRSNLIALILSDIKETDANGNIIYRLLLGAQSVCSQRGYELVIIFTNDEKQQKKSLRELCKERNLCGFIIYGLKLSNPYYHEIDSLTIPCVTLDVETEHHVPAVVCTDNKQAVGEVVSLFYERGRRKIAMMNGSHEAYVSFLREDSFRNAMASYSLPVRDGMVRYGDYFESKAYQETLLLMQAHPETDAIFAASDIMAMGVLRALKDLGKAVPQDVALVGFDGIQTSEYTNPPLTTIYQDFKAMGASAVESVIKILEGKPYQHINYVPHQLVLRKST